MSRHIERRTALALAGLGLALMASRASANWTAMPGAVQASGLPAHVQVATAPDGLGGMYVAWNDSVGPGETTNAYVKIQRFDRAGNALWPPGGINLDLGSHADDSPPVDVCPDNAGGVFVCWNKYIDGFFIGHKVRAVHLDASGAALSPFLDVSTDAFNDPGAATIAPDGQGGAVVTWIDEFGWGNTFPCTNVFHPSTVHAQRIDGFGNFLWGSAGKAISPIYEVHPNQRNIVPVRAVAEGSGVYFVWNALISGCNNGLVKIQRVDLGTGQPTFDPGGLVLESEPGSVPNGYAFPTSNGACLVVVDGFDPRGLHVERVASNGAIDWTTPSLTDRCDFYIHPESDGLGGVLIPWFRLDIGMMVQNVDAAGQLKYPQLSPTARGTVTGDQSFSETRFGSHVAPDGKGGVIVATPCWHPNNAFPEIFCQGVNFAGRPAFRTSGLQVSSPGQQAIFASACHGLINNVLLAWGNANGVWAQQVTLSNLDVLTTPAGWDANLVPRANNGATPGSVVSTVLIEGNQTWLNWAVLQRGPNPTAAFQSRVYLDGNPTSNMFWGQNVSDGANPAFYKTLNFGPFNIPGGPHTLTLYADEEFGPDFSIDEATESDDVWGRQWIWEPAIVQAPGPITGGPIGGSKGNSSPPNGTGHKLKLPGAPAGAMDAWVVSNAARRGPTFDSSGGVSSYGDSYGLMLYDLPAGAGEFTDLIGESHQPYNGTNFIVSMMSFLPDSLYPLEVRDSTADAEPDSTQFDLEFAGTRVGPGDGSSWSGQAMAPGELADVYVLMASPEQMLHLTLTRRESPSGGDRPLAFEVFPPALEGLPTFARGSGIAAQAASADIETLTFVAPRGGPYLVVVYRPDGTGAGAPLTYDFQSSGTQTLGASPPKRLAFAFAGAEPNPVHAGAEFAFTIPEAGDATLMLYDVNGRAVRELVHGAVESGRQRVRWDGRGADGSRLGGGLYFARLTWGGHTSVRRVAVVP